MDRQIYVTNSSEQTGEIAQKIAKKLRGGEILCLYGDLGSGKTTFTQGLAKGLGIKQRVISPTFVIIRNYRIKNYESRIMNFYHIDLYRTGKESDIKNLGIAEIISDSENIVVIEWAEKMGKLLPEKRIDIWFEHVDNNKRKITKKNF